jgi:AraC-like DNA-binding protein
LKPVGADDLIATVRHAVERIEEKRRAPAAGADPDQTLVHARAALIGRFLESDNFPAQSFRAESSSLGLHVAAPFVRIACSVPPEGLDDQSTLGLVADSSAGRGCHAFVLRAGVVLLASGNEDPRAALCEMARRLLDRVGGEAAFGVGGCHEGAQGLRVSYREAMQAADLFAFRGGSRVFVWDDIDRSEIAGPFVRPANLGEALSTAVLEGATARVIRLIGDYEHAARAHGHGFAQVKEDFRSLLIAISEDAGRAGRITPAEDRGFRSTVTELGRAPTLRDLCRRGRRALEELTRVAGHPAQSGLRGVAAFAVNYAALHYRQPLRAREIARMARVTPNYFSRAFKKDVGVGFVQWLNRYRIRKAKELLADVGARVYEVAAEVGLPNQRYFASLFKRETGRTPKQYQHWRAAHQDLDGDRAGAER